MRSTSALLAAVLTACVGSPGSSATDSEGLPGDAFIRGSRVRTLLPPDAIPSIDDPRFVPAEAAGFMRDDEPVIGLVVDGEARAYSAWHLDRHEIVNDRVGDTPVAVTW